MRRLFAPLLLLALAPMASAHNAHPWPPANHSPHVASVMWVPQEPARGQDVPVVAVLRGAPGADAVLLRVCRVEAYACMAPLELAPSQGGQGDEVFGARIPWERTFFKGVTQVGLAVILQFPNGTTEESPLTSWPAQPAELPEGAGQYYFYPLPAEAKAPSPGLGALFAAAAAAAMAARRRA